MKIKRYIIGFILGALVMHLGRYKIHAVHLILLLGIILYICYDLKKKL